jgi:hypothetical protein
MDSVSSNMIATDTASIEEIDKRLQYNPESGLFVWRDGKRKGQQAGSVNSHGYLYLKINKKIYKCHRIAFLLTYGKWPELVDHINGIRSDNRISNLREASSSQNRMNAKTRRDNTSGHPGVKWHSELQKWRAEIKKGGRIITLGMFEEKTDAVAARQKAQQEYFGEFNSNRQNMLTRLNE